ncbi:hypothetical protein CR105_04590 [Massilia eurypsychrophila]|uniref:Uncharacterized protein n=1 Tax=Massilia eurypsychrophila TaxID=1485217 RepID=A0A2G8TJY9_9BURK|nr:hypothetical protein CR105_04590 [Massilia eurypsychrophila]
MRQLTIEFDDEEAAQLEADARACGIDPARRTKTQLLQLLGNASGKRKANAEAAPPDTQETKMPARARRLEALMPMQGIWKGDPDKPQDGVAYQREVRAEWR